jgi:hypothetical protein
MTMPDDPLTYERAAERIGRFMVAIAVLGTASAWSAGGWMWGAGFLIGASISGLNFRWLKKLVEGLGGQSTGDRPGGLSHSTAFLALRYLLLGGAAYVILRFSPISLTAVIVGLFVLIGAVFVEVIVEIMYARK